MRITQITVCLVIICALVINLTGCASVARAQNLMNGITANDIGVTDCPESKNAAVTDFAIRLLRIGEDGKENTLISPLSLMCALSMTANGAENATLAQMEEVLGGAIGDLNNYLHSYLKGLPEGDNYKLSLANSVWFTDNTHFSENRSFLQTNADYYGADIYKCHFDDSTCRDINSWIKKNTDGMIPEILDRISPEAVMFLINALAFDAEWSDPYEKQQINNGTFTKEDGTLQSAEFMSSNESTYLEDENAVGFIKYYSERKYAFVALLPDEGTSITEYIAGLDGKSMHKLLTTPQRTAVRASIPKFETSYSAEMSEVLMQMGITEAFDRHKADFSGIGTYTDDNIYISRILHKTYISVDDLGTRAGAATAVSLERNMASPDESAEVCLDRPFVYMLIDCENFVPFFIGTMMDIEKH